MSQRNSASSWPPGSGEMDRCIREHDWAATPLGPVEGWPERLRAAVEMMLIDPRPTSLAVAPARTFLFNDAAARIYGSRAPDLLGLALPQAFPSYSEVADLYDRAFAGEPGEIRAKPLAVTDAGGEVFDATLLPVGDGMGGVLAVLVTAVEVGARLRAEADLRESEARRRLLGAAWETDANGVVTADSPSWRAYTGQSLDEWLGYGWLDAVHPDDRAYAERQWRDAVAANRIVDAEFRLRAPDGGWRWTNVRAAPVLDAEGKIEKWAGMNIDIEAHYRLLFESMDQGYALGEVIFDEKGRAIDVTFLVANPAVARILEFDIAGRRMIEFADLEPSWYEHWGRVARTGQPERREDYAAAIGRWLEFYLFKPDPEERNSNRVAVLIEDVTERRQAEERLRKSEARLRNVLRIQTVGVMFWSGGFSLMEVNDAFLRMTGFTREEALGKTWEELTPPEFHDASHKAIEEVATRGECTPYEKQYVRKDGSRWWGLFAARRIDDEVVEFVLDVTERREAEAALRESEERFRQFGDASADVLWIRDCKTLALEYVSPAFEQVYGHRIEEVLGGNHIRRWAELILPEDREKALDNLRRVREGEQVSQSFRILRSDGQVRWMRDTSFPLLDEQGRVQRIAGIGHDATEEVELHDRLRVLVAELQHRSRNLVTVVRGVTDRTLATSETLDDFRTRIRERLAALGRVNALLSRLEEGHRITFDQLLQAELTAHGVVDEAGEGPQATLRGLKGIRLRSATVQTFALAIHELTTNALKYGALSRPEGHLEVTWSLESGEGGERRLHVDWRETGVSVVHPDGATAEGTVDGTPGPCRKGYGRELIERALPYQLRAQTDYALTAEGVRCTIIVPVSSTLDLAFSRHGEDDA